MTLQEEVTEKMLAGDATEQEIFNAAWDWFGVQRKPASIIRGVCVYRGPRKRRCGVGIFIPDNRYMSAMEGSNSNIIIGGYLPEFGPYKYILAAIQECHDSTSGTDAFSEEFRSKMKALAVEFNLQVPEGVAT
jgi:hypothetical protein